MKSIGNSSDKQLKDNLIYFIIISAFIGLLASSYLLINMLTGLGQSCTPLQACYLNTESYSNIFTSNMIFFPAVYFLSTLLLVLYFFTTENKKLGKMLYYFTSASLLIVAMFLYLQVYRYKGFCPVCLAMFVSSFMLFASSLYLPKYLK